MNLVSPITARNRMAAPHDGARLAI
jgi:hypothetical protein